MKKLAISFILVLTGCGNPVGIRFDSSVPDEHRRLIELDLARISELNLPPAETSDLAALSIGALSSAAMVDWLKRRIRYITGEEFNWRDNAQIVDRANEATPFIMLANVFQNPFEAGTAQTVMWNLGSYMYLEGKKNKVTYYLDVAGDQIEVFSPRSGVVQIGEGLFSANRVKSTPADSLANSMMRISTYFHEARHSDGNGDNAAFPHSQCPSGDYKDLYACERNLNGPYAVNTIMLKYMYQACRGCTQAELEAMTLSIADYKTRILYGAQYNDSRPEAMQ